MSLIKHTATIGGYTLISRVFGFIRDVIIASALGASFLSDAFFVAFKLPNFLRRLFAEGAFNSAFVPLFSGMLAVEGKEEARRFADNVFSILMLVLLGVTLLFIAAMPWLMYLLAPGFSDDPAKFGLTIDLTRITFPYILFISAVSLLGGMLNSGGKFAAVAATPIVMNLCLIAAPFAFGPLTPTAAHALAIGVFMAGLAQYAWLAHFARRAGMLPRFVRPRMDAQVKKLLVLIGPAALGAGVAQINLLIDLIIASHIDNAVSYLYYADRINELPLAVIGIAVGTALLPVLSRQIRAGERAAAMHTQNRAIELALLLSLPAAAALMVIAEPIIVVMFQHGKFGAVETDATFRALVAFAAGLPAFVLVKVISPAFYANHDTKTPFKIATVCILLNLALNLALIIPLRHVGMALATTIAGWANVGLMLWVLRKRALYLPDAALLSRLPRMLAATALMALVLWGAHTALEDLFTASLLAKILALSALVAAGLAAFVTAALLLRAVDCGRLRAILRK